MSDEVNIYEDITDLIANIDWKNVTLGLIFEMIIKFPHLMQKDELEKNLTEAVDFKLKVNEVDKKDQRRFTIDDYNQGEESNRGRTQVILF